MAEAVSGDSTNTLEEGLSAAVTHKGECPSCRTWIAVRWMTKKTDRLWIACPNCNLTMGLGPHVRPHVALKEMTA
jgi:hypothetical protein